jgi:hypothetical protein
MGMAVAWVKGLEGDFFAQLVLSSLTQNSHKGGNNRGMSKAATNRKIEQPEIALRHFLTEMPYRAITYARSNATAPLFWVAGKEGGPWGAERALREAHKTHKGECFYCKKPVSDDALSIDHIEPQTKGGQSSIHNLVIACKPCNLGKGSKSIEAYDPKAGRAWLEQLLAQVQDRLNRLR